MEHWTRFFKPILIIIILLSFNAQQGHAKPSTGQVPPEYEDESQEVLPQLSVSRLLERWMVAVERKDATEEKLSRFIEEATVKGVSQGLEDRIIKVRNQKMDSVKRVGDLESEIDSRQTSRWQSTDSKETIERNKTLNEGMTNAFNSLRDNVGVPVMAYFDSSMPQNKVFSIDDMFEHPRIFRNIYYFLNNAYLDRNQNSQIENVIAGVMITRTPPVSMVGSVGFKRVNSSNEIFGGSAGAGVQFDPPKYVLYISPDASYEDLMRDYENAAEMMMLEQRGHMAEAVADAGLNPFCEGMNNRDRVDLYNIRSNLASSQEQYVENMEKLNKTLNEIDALWPQESTHLPTENKLNPPPDQGHSVPMDRQPYNSGPSGGLDYSKIPEEGYSEPLPLQDVLNKYKNSLQSNFLKQKFEELNLNQNMILDYLYRELDKSRRAYDSPDVMRKLQDAIYQVQSNQVSAHIFYTEEDKCFWMFGKGGVVLFDSSHSSSSEENN